MSELKPSLQPPIRYDSAIDLWLGFTLMLAPVVSAAIGIYLIRIGRVGDASYLFLTSLVTLLVTGIFCVPCRYTILHDAISIRCGILCYQIPLNEIRKIERSGSLKSAPALSTRRVRIQTEQREYLVSPKDRDGFIKTVEEHRERYFTATM